MYFLRRVRGNIALDDAMKRRRSHLIDENGKWSQFAGYTVPTAWVCKRPRRLMPIRDWSVVDPVLHVGPLVKDSHFYSSATVFSRAKNSSSLCTSKPSDPVARHRDVAKRVKEEAISHTDQIIMYAANMETNYPDARDDGEHRPAVAWPYGSSAPAPSSYSSGPGMLPYSAANPMRVPAYVYPSELISGLRQSQPTYGNSPETTSAAPYFNYMAQDSWSGQNATMGHLGDYSMEPRGARSWYNTIQSPQPYDVYSQYPGNNSVSMAENQSMSQWQDHTSPDANHSAYPSASPLQVPSAQSPFHSSEASWLREIDGAFDRNPDGSSIHETGSIYLPENERYYHRYKEGSYWFPNDAVGHLCSIVYFHLSAYSFQYFRCFLQ